LRVRSTDSPRPNVILLAITLLTALAGVSPVFAQADQYRALTHAAVEEHALGHFEEARALFAKAHAINPNARTLWGMGIAAFETRRYVDAIELLKSALGDARKPLTSAQRKDAESVIERSQAFVAHVPLRIAPPAASVSIDAREVAKGGDGVVMLDPGVHQVVVSAAGYHEVARSMRWEAGPAPVLEVNLEPKIAAPAAAAEAQPTQLASPVRTADGPSESRRSVRVLKWVSLGATVAAGGVMTAGLALRESAAEKWNECPEPMAENCPDTRATHDRWRALAIGTGVSTGVFAALTVGLFVVDRRRAAHSHGALSVCSPAFTLGALCRLQF
jgi:tetratricopeptide (TPR) repeat protein